ncbi:MAG TPA: class I SAM-dependent RNA methyltransferase, partial [Hyphomicrobiaceae bacterium]|nr:class I SAM-dependent RNA methyltransferase [Hyphomicrobiaceae bacterium]
MTTRVQEVEIDALGAQGDGIVDAPSGQRLYVPFALPSERWRIAEGARDTLLRAHPRRATPVCQHFGNCGGCVAQHVPDDLYTAWKRGMVVHAFMHRGIEAPVGDLVRVPLASRRRMTVYARRYRQNFHIGYYRAATHYILNVVECPIAVPAIVAALPVLREMLEPLLSGQGEAGVTMLATPAGLDVHMTFIHVGSVRKEYPRMAALAARNGFARLTVETDAIVQSRRPLLMFGGVEVEPPPGAFVQAVAEAESAMVQLVAGAAGKAKRIADLFCGIGTFTFPLARHARVLAVDQEEEAVAALRSAARCARGLKPIEGRVRDLFRMPISAKELAGFDAVVIDPSRSGAEKQACQIAQSSV